MKYKFTVLEGIDGSGTTTQTELVSEALGIEKILLTKEPTSYSPSGMRIREILRGGHSDKEELLDLFISDRRWHNENILIPYLKNGFIILCDRYVFSTYAYQKLHGFSIKEINKRQGKILIPDITFLLDIDVDTALERTENRNIEREIFEKRNFLIKCRQAYLNLFMDNHNKIRLIDGDQPREKVTKDIVEYLL